MIKITKKGIVYQHHPCHSWWIIVWLDLKDCLWWTVGTSRVKPTCIIEAVETEPEIFIPILCLPCLEWSSIPAKERVSGPSAKGNSSKPSTLSWWWLRQGKNGFHFKSRMNHFKHNEDEVATCYWLTLKLIWLLVNGEIVKSSLWEKDHSPSRVISGAAPTPVVQLRRQGGLFGMSDESWTWSAVTLAEYWQLTTEREGNHHDLARCAQLSMSARQGGSCCFLWVMQFCTRLWVGFILHFSIFCWAVEFSIRLWWWLQSPAGQSHKQNNWETEPLDSWRLPL